MDANNSMPGMDMTVIVQSYIDGFRTFMDSAETLDLALSMQGDRTDLSLAFTALEKSALADLGSKEKTGIDQLAKCLDPDAPFAVLLGMDIAAMAKRYQPLLDSLMAMYPESMRAPLTASMGSWKEIYPLLGTGLAISGELAPTGLRATCYFRPKDSKALLEQMSKVLKDFKMPGVTVKPLDPITVDGVAVTQFHFDVDTKALSALAGDKADPAVGTQLDSMVKKIYGANGTRVAFGSKGDLMVQVIGGDEAYLKRAIATLGESNRKAPREMQAFLDKAAGFNPCFVSQFDVARYFAQVMELASPAADADKKKPASIPSAPILFHGGIEGRVWRGGASWDMGRVAAGMKQAFDSSSAGSKVGAASGGKAKADIIAIDSALKEYAIMNGGKYPDSLAVLVVPDANGRKFLESKALPRDPWGHEYLYDPPSAQHPEPRVYSYGKDGKPGGEGEDADIDNASLKDAGK
jgi:general secretion pathway protein G